MSVFCFQDVRNTMLSDYSVAESEQLGSKCVLFMYAHLNTCQKYTPCKGDDKQHWFINPFCYTGRSIFYYIQVNQITP